MDRNHLNRILESRKESELIDFKSEFYYHSYIKRECSKDELQNIYEKQAALIQDCISFLNNGVNSDKYIVCGIDDSGNISNRFKQVDIDESKLQELVQTYIQPKPIIEFVEETYLGEDIFVIVISHKNPSVLFSVSKDLQDTEQKRLLNIDDSFTREGTRNRKITVVEAHDFNSKLDPLLRVIPFQKIESNNISEILYFFKFVTEYIIDSEKLLKYLESDIHLSIKFNSMVELIIKEGVANPQPNEFDGGANSIIESIFEISGKLFNIFKSGLFEFNKSLGKIEISYSGHETCSYSEFNEIKHSLAQVNQKFQSFIQIQYKINSYFFKITEVNFSSEIEGTFNDNEFHFNVSDRVMHLFLEPLYRQTNSFEVVIREMLQNSFDACSQIKGKPKIVIDFNFKDGKLSSFSVIDNGKGMDAEDIKKYFLTVGNSSKDSAKSDTVGQFGIGALSMFLVGDKATIQTKKIKSEPICLSLIRDNFIVKKQACAHESYGSQSHYTRIEISVNKEKFSYSPSEIKNILYIENYFVNDDVDLIFNFNEDGFQESYFSKYLSSSIRGDLFHETSLSDNKKILILKPDAENIHDEHSKTFEILNKTFHSRILTNNQISKVSYTNLSSNVKGIPFIISLDGLKSLPGVDVELSRARIIVNEKTTNEIENIYRNLALFAADKFIKELTTDSTNRNDYFGKLEEINQYHEKKLMIKSPDIFMNKDYIGYAPKEASYHVNLHVNEIYPNIFDAIIDSSEELGIPYFVRHALTTERKEVADILEEENVISIHKNILQRFLIRAQKSGLRRNANSLLLRKLGFSSSDYADLLNDFWNCKSNYISTIEKSIDDRTVGSMVYLDSNDKDGKIHPTEQIGKLISNKILSATEDPSKHYFGNFIISKTFSN